MEYGTLYFSTNAAWAEMKVDYEYDDTTFYITEVYSKITQYASVYRTFDGQITLNGTPIYSSTSDRFMIDSFDEWYAHGISGSISIENATTVTIAFKPVTYSAFFAVHATSDYQWKVTESQTVTVSSESSETVNSYTLTMQTGDGVYVDVYRASTSYGYIDYLYDGDIIYDGDILQITCGIFDDSYSMTLLSINDTLYSYNDAIELTVSGDINIILTSESNSGEARLGQATSLNCLINGVCARYIRTDRPIGNMDSPQYTDNYAMVGLDVEGYKRVCIIKFTSPNFIGAASNITFNFDTNMTTSGVNRPQIHYALCTSDSNYLKYYGECEMGEVIESNQIFTGITEIAITGPDSISIPINPILKSNQTYYLFLYPYDDSNGSAYGATIAYTDLGNFQAKIDYYYCTSSIKITNEYQNLEYTTLDCRFLGSRNSYDSDYGNNEIYIQANETGYYKFKTPSFDEGTIDSLLVVFDDGYDIDIADNADASFGCDLMSDEDTEVQTSGDWIGNAYIFNNVNLEPDTIYYISIGCNATSADAATMTASATLTIKLNGSFKINTNSYIVDEYLCYIDNGTSWDLCIPCIDNGANWS